MYVYYIVCLLFPFVQGGFVGECHMLYITLNFFISFYIWVMAFSTARPEMRWKPYKENINKINKFAVQCIAE